MEHAAVFELLPGDILREVGMLRSVTVLEPVVLTPQIFVRSCLTQRLLRLAYVARILEGICRLLAGKVVNPLLGLRKVLIQNAHRFALLDKFARRIRKRIPERKGGGGEAFEYAVHLFALFLRELLLRGEFFVFLRQRAHVVPVRRELRDPLRIIDGRSRLRLTTRDQRDDGR